MPYSIGETYVWLDGNGAVHVWGKVDEKLQGSVWHTTHSNENIAGVVLSASIWKVVKEAIVREVLGDTAKRILVGEYSTGQEEPAHG